MRKGGPVGNDLGKVDAVVHKKQEQYTFRPNNLVAICKQ